MAPPTKRRKTSALTIEEIAFDHTARHDYLTGFHKRKQARVKAAQEAAARREKEDRMRERRRIRQQRDEDLARHVESVNSLIEVGADQGSGEDEEVEEGERSADEWGGFEDAPVLNREDEYIDEDKFTTVTVEEVNITKDGIENIVDGDASGDSEQDGEEDGRAMGTNGGKSREDLGDKKKRVWTKERPARDGSKKKRKKFRYETKSERKFTKTKEKSRNRAQANARRG